MSRARVWVEKIYKWECPKCQNLNVMSDPADYSWPGAVNPAINKDADGMFVERMCSCCSFIGSIYI